MNTHTHLSSKKPLIAGMVAATASGLWWYRTPLLSLLSALRDQQAVSAFVQQYGAVGPVVLFGLLVVQVILAVLPGQALIIAGGYLYGFATGALVTASGTIVGGLLAFWLARLCGRNVVNRLASPSIVARWDRLAAHQGGMFFFLTFILPIFPSDLLCYVAGLGKVRPRTFFFVNIIGRVPCAIILSMFGANGLRLPIQFWLAIAVGLTLLFIAWGVYSRRNHIGGDPGAKFYEVIGRLVNCYITILRLRCKARGAATLPAGPKILAANHPNVTDAFFLPGILPDRLYLLAQGSLFNLPVLGWLFSRAGLIPVWPDRRGKAFEAACEHLRQGHTILIFPEGKLNPARSALQAGTGAVRMSLETGAPIIPFGIYVADQDVVSLKYRSKLGAHTGRWQVRGCCAFQFGEAWDPSREVLHTEDAAPTRYLTGMLMDKIGVLVLAAEQELSLERSIRTGVIAHQDKHWQAASPIGCDL